MTTITELNNDELSTITGGADQRPTSGAPQAARDGARMASSAVDIARGSQGVRQTVDGAISGGQKGYNLPAKNGWERAVNTIGGAAIDAFGLGW